MRNGKAPGPSGLRAETLKDWMAEFQESTKEVEEERDSLQKSKLISQLVHLPWYKFMTVLGNIFQSGVVPSQLCFETMVLIP